ncbi:hypothetical protein [uncultured Duncaniella sp.]|uniref:hypothetical protein n=1 Tax=uncultured Duncaniella sp. TaxID=2768039 RepID=UPI00260D77FE|nr:hypothetical protein [uncultured Duncaniella sp.]
MAITEATLSKDEFNQPKVLKNAEAIACLLTRLLLLEPGTIQSHPNMGVGLVSNYRYSTNSEADLQQRFTKQIETYLPQYQGAEIRVQEKDRVLVIGGRLDDNIFAIFYDREKGGITTTYKRLSDL